MKTATQTEAQQREGWQEWLEWYNSEQKYWEEEGWESIFETIIDFDRYKLEAELLEKWLNKLDSGRMHIPMTYEEFKARIEKEERILEEKSKNETNSREIISRVQPCLKEEEEQDSIPSESEAEDEEPETDNEEEEFCDKTETNREEEENKNYFTNERKDEEKFEHTLPVFDGKEKEDSLKKFLKTVQKFVDTFLCDVEASIICHF